MMMWGYGFNMGWMWLMWALALVIVGLIVFVVVWAVNGAARREASSGRIGQLHDPPVRSTSRQILDERYARGELTADEYREHLTVLGEG
ncbi:MAG: SHOCT domain-containing protein [Terrimesophilobacter sp.]